MLTNPPFIRVPEETIALIEKTKCTRVAEIGILEGNTSNRIVSVLPKDGQLHLFDYTPHVDRVLARLRAMGHTNVVGHPNSNKTKDSYNWSLMKLIRKNPRPIFDYVYLDGAHSWQIDALTFFLVDRLLKVGGYIDFDDYNWSFAKSPTMNPKVRPRTTLEYTDEQIQECHIALVVDLLVKRDRRYEEIVRNKIFRKTAE